MVNAILTTAASKEMVKSIEVALAIGALDTMIGQHAVHLVRDGRYPVPEERSGDHVVRFCMGLGIA